VHYYSYNIADYRKDTGHLTPIEHYIYRSLMDWYYLDELPIPLETQVVLRRLSLGNDSLTNLENVLIDFFDKEEDGYHQTRIDLAISEYHAKAKKNKVNGKLGGRPKKTQVVISGIATDKPSESQNNPNHKPITNNHKKDITPLAMLVAMDVPESLAKDWLKVRKEKKAAPTQTAFDAIKKHAEDNGYTFAQAVKIATENGWSGFKVDWINNAKTQQGIPTKSHGVSTQTDDAQLINLAHLYKISTTGLSKPTLVSKINKAMGVH
jgi:uncharacterized protein YdaU (DUF1376 family)